jgi:YD repeat-containing protein
MDFFGRVLLRSGCRVSRIYPPRVKHQTPFPFIQKWKHRASYFFSALLTCGIVSMQSHAQPAPDAASILLASSGYQAAAASAPSRPSPTSLQKFSLIKTAASIGSPYETISGLMGYYLDGFNGDVPNCYFPPVYGATLTAIANAAVASHNAVKSKLCEGCGFPETLYSVDQANGVFNIQSICTGAVYSYKPKQGYSAKTSFHECPSLGNPCNIPSGAKVQTETDYESSNGGLAQKRTYNSRLTSSFAGMLGPGWRIEYENSASTFSSPTTAADVEANGLVSFVRSSGQILQFSYNSSSAAWIPDPDITARVQERDDASGNFVGWSLYPETSALREDYDKLGHLLTIDYGNGRVITLQYNSVGQLQTATDAEGRALTFSYTGSGTSLRLSTLTLPDGNVITYAYSNGQLASAMYPAGPDGVSHSRAYGYTSGLLTSLTDERGIVSSSWAYNTSGQVTASMRGTPSAPLSTYGFQYNSDGSVTTTSPLGQVNTLTSQAVLSVNHVTGSNIYCADCGSLTKRSDYATNGRLSDTTDFLGVRTIFTYDTTGMETSRVEASGTTAQRTVQTTWDSFYKLPTTITTLAADGHAVTQEARTYNSRGQLTARCDIDPAVVNGYTCINTGTSPAGVRRWAYTYCDVVDSTQCPVVGLLLSVTGPRTDIGDVTSYSYYLSTDQSGCGTSGGACHNAGDLYQITDALGHVFTAMTYDKDGRMTRTRGTNGVVTDFTYHSRGWLLSQTVRADADGSPSVQDAITQIAYDAMGNVTQVTDPDGVATSYTYDTAHRLTRVTDASGNYLQYTLDGEGDKTGEQVYDTSGASHKNLIRTFNTLGQLTTVVDGLNHTVFNASASNSYDANGNLVQSTDGLGIQRQLGYDALNRLVQTLNNYNATN